MTAPQQSSLPPTAHRPPPTAHHLPDSHPFTRRGFLASAATAAAVAQPALVLGAAKAKYRVAMIGHTGHGDYGHNLHMAWQHVPGVGAVGVADADPEGLAKAVKQLGGVKGFADYRKMLAELKPEFLCIALRWLDQHHDLVLAAAESGVRGIYMEKPLCPTLAQADEMVAACQKNKVKLAIAHTTRYSPKLPVVKELLTSGKLGRILEFRARGKEDQRGGAEDLWVLGTHVLDMIHCLGGKPQSCFGTVLQKGQPIRAADIKPGAEGIGPLAGDEVHALYRLESGATAAFDSVRNGSTAKSTRFGFQVYGTEGVIEMYTGYLPGAYILLDPAWSPCRTKSRWQNVSTNGVGKPETMTETVKGQQGNIAAITDLIAAVEQDRQPAADIQSARVATEMIVAVFESHRLGKPVSWPLENRQNPLEMMKG